LHVLPESVGVACSPILSVSLEAMGCEPILNLAATPDEAVSIIFTIVDKTIPSTFWEKLMYASYTTDRPRSSVGHPVGALALSCIWILLTWLTYAYGMLSQDDIPSWRVFTTPMCMPIVWTGHFNSCLFVINY
jgi:hypothetical protein